MGYYLMPAAGGKPVIVRMIPPGPPGKITLPDVSLPDVLFSEEQITGWPTERVGLHRDKVLDCRVGDYITLADWDVHPWPVPGTDGWRFRFHAECYVRIA